MSWAVIGLNGEQEYFFGVGIDITDRKRAEEALKLALSEVEKLKNRLEEENLYFQTVI